MGQWRSRGSLVGLSSWWVFTEHLSACPKQTWERLSSVACSLRIAMEAFMAILKEGLGGMSEARAVLGMPTLSLQLPGGKRSVWIYTQWDPTTTQSSQNHHAEWQAEVSRNDLLPCLTTLGLCHTGAEAGGWNINEIYQKQQKKKAYEQNGKLNFLQASNISKLLIFFKALSFSSFHI